VESVITTASGTLHEDATFTRRRQPLNHESNISEIRSKLDLDLLAETMAGQLFATFPHWGSAERLLWICPAVRCRRFRLDGATAGRQLRLRHAFSRKRCVFTKIILWSMSNSITMFTTGKIIARCVLLKRRQHHLVSCRIPEIGIKKRWFKVPRAN